MSSRDRRIAQLLTAWFDSNARLLPWRTALGEGRDPYAALVSEAMLQQTQAARVAERFDGFIARFPSIEALAAADEQDVLAAWAGLGYYRRAKNLHAAARAVVDRFESRIPDTVEDLLSLPGIGRYTAGSIASIVFGRTVPIVDGNVRRVILRVDGEDLLPEEAATEAYVWRRAGELVSAAPSAGVFNEALMELGATVCTPRGPCCGACPLARSCVAHRNGAQDRIPRPKIRAAATEIFHAAVLITDSRGRILVEQRPAKGLWASMWQAPTLERDGRPANRTQIVEAFGLTSLIRADGFAHRTTHRLVRFTVYRAALRPRRRPVRGRFLSAEEVSHLPIANPHQRILALATSSRAGV